MPNGLDAFKLENSLCSFGSALYYSGQFHGDGNLIPPLGKLGQEIDRHSQAMPKGIA
jgi:hypothetical protein